jgi:hypothetical protein
MNLSRIDLTENHLMDTNKRRTIDRRIPNLLLPPNEQIGIASMSMDYAITTIQDSFISTDDLIDSQDMILSSITYDIFDGNELTSFAGRRNYSGPSRRTPECLDRYCFTTPRLPSIFEKPFDFNKHVKGLIPKFLTEASKHARPYYPRICDSLIKDSFTRGSRGRWFSNHRELLDRAPIIEKSYRTNLNRSIDWTELELRLIIAKERLEELLQN